MKALDANGMKEIQDGAFFLLFYRRYAVSLAAHASTAGTAPGLGISQVNLVGRGFSAVLLALTRAEWMTGISISSYA